MIEIVEVFWLRVRFVAVLVFQTVPVPLKVQVPDPMVRVLVLELAEEKTPVETFLLLALKVPAVWVNVAVLPRVTLSCI